MGPEGSLQQFRGGRGGIGEGVKACRVEARGALGPTPHMRSMGKGARKLVTRSGRADDEAVGLLGIAGDLGHELRGGHAGRGRKADLAGDLGLHGSGDGLSVAEEASARRDVEEHLSRWRGPRRAACSARRQQRLARLFRRIADGAAGPRERAARGAWLQPWAWPNARQSSGTGSR